MSDIDRLWEKLEKLDDKLDEINSKHTANTVVLEHHTKQENEVSQDLKTIGSHLLQQSKLLNDYNASLREHIRRTEILEDKVAPMFGEYTEREISKKLQLEQDVTKTSKWKRHATIFGTISAMIALIAGIVQLIKLI